jgi:hypothetical protein
MKPQLRIEGVPMSSAPVRLDNWISPARFDAVHGAAGLDQDFGFLWGPRADQRVSLRLQPGAQHGAQHGVLYAHDPLWDEYLILDPSVTRDEVTDAFRDVVNRRGDRGVPVGVLADAVRQRQLELLLAAASEPQNLCELGIEP